MGHQEVAIIIQKIKTCPEAITTILLLGTLTNFYKTLNYAPTNFRCIYVCTYRYVYNRLSILPNQVWWPTGRHNI